MAPSLHVGVLTLCVPGQSARWEAPPPHEIAAIRRQAGTEEGTAEAGEVHPAAADPAPFGRDSADTADTAAEKEAEHRE